MLFITLEEKQLLRFATVIFFRIVAVWFYCVVPSLLFPAVMLSDLCRSDYPYTSVEILLPVVWISILPRFAYPLNIGQPIRKPSLKAQATSRVAFMFSINVKIRF